MKKVLNFVKRKQPSGSLPDLPSSSSSHARRRSSVASVASSVLALATSGGSGRSEGGASKLHLAVWNEDVERVNKIVAKNDVNVVNAVDASGRTPLHLAAEKGLAGLAGPLLLHGAVVQARDGQGATPLHRAVENGHLEVANMLLDKGCPLDVSDINGDTVLHLANRNECNDILAILLRKGANPDLKNKKGESPLLESIRLGHVSAAQLLLRCGASVNQPGPRGVTPLMLACADAKVAALVETLLDYEADPIMADKRGWNAVRYAQEANLLEVVDMIENFIEAQNQAIGDTGDSFDDEDPYGEEIFHPMVGTPLERTDHPARTIRSSKGSYVGGVPAVPVSDLSSWESNSPISGLDQPIPGILKHSKGITDLSKFLNSDDEVDQDQRNNDKPKSPEKKVQVDDVKKVKDEVMTDPDDDDDWSADSVPGLLVMDSAEQRDISSKPITPTPKEQPTIVISPAKAYSPSAFTVPAKVIQPTASAASAASNVSSPSAEKIPDKLDARRSSLLTDELKEALGKRLATNNNNNADSANASSRSFEKNDVDKEQEIQTGNSKVASGRRKKRRDSRANRSMKSTLSRETTSSESDFDFDEEVHKVRHKPSNKKKLLEKPLLDGDTVDNASQSVSPKIGLITPVKAKEIGVDKGKTVKEGTVQKNTVIVGKSVEAKTTSKQETNLKKLEPMASQPIITSDKAPLKPIVDKSVKPLVKNVTSATTAVTAPKPTVAKTANPAVIQKATETKATPKAQLPETKPKAVNATTAKSKADKVITESKPKSVSAAKPKDDKIASDANTKIASNAKPKVEKVASAAAEAKPKVTATKPNVSPKAKTADNKADDSTNKTVKPAVATQKPTIKAASQAKSETSTKPKPEPHKPDASATKLTANKAGEAKANAKSPAKSLDNEKSDLTKNTNASTEKSVRSVKEAFFNKIVGIQSGNKTNDTTNKTAKSVQSGSGAKGDQIVPAGQMLPPEIMGMDKTDLLVYVQKLHLSLEEYKRAQKPDISSKQTSETDSKLLKQLTNDNKKLKEELVSSSISLQHAINERQAVLDNRDKDLKLANQLQEELSAKIDDLKLVEMKAKEIEAELDQEKSQRQHFETLYQTSVDAKKDESSKEVLKLTDELKMLEKERNGLKEKLEQERNKHKEETLHSTSEKEALQTSVKELQSALSNASKKLKESEMALELERKNFEILKTDGRQSLTDNFKDDLEEERQRVVATNLTLKRMETSLEEKVRDLEILQKKYALRDTEFSDLEIEAKVLRQELSDLKSAAARKEQLNVGVKEKLQRDKEELTSRAEQLDLALESAKQQLRQKQEERQAEIQDLEAAVEAAKKEKKTLLSEKEELEDKLDQAKQEMKRQVNERNKTITDLSEELAELKSAKERLDKLTESLKKQLTGRPAEAASDVDRLEAANTRLEAEVKAVTIQRDEMAEAAKRWEKEAKRAGDSNVEQVREELERMERLLEERGRELAAARGNMSKQNQGKIHEQERLMSMKVTETLEVNKQLQTAQQKISSLEEHIGHLQGRIDHLEESLAASNKEKQAILAKLRKKEAECDDLNVNVVEVLRQQLKNEQQKLEKEQEKVETLEAKKKLLERDIGKLNAELTESKQELASSGTDKKKLKKELTDLSDHIHTLEQKLDSEKRVHSKNANLMTALEEKISEEQRKNKMAEKRIEQLMDEFEKEQVERLKAEQILEKRLAERSVQTPIIDSLRGKVAKLQKENLELSRKFSETASQQKSAEHHAKRSKELSQELHKQEKVIEELEERLSNVRKTESAKYHSELKRFKLKFEIMARNEVNQKLSEINAFLEERAVEQTQNEKSRDEVMERIQKDLGEKLQQSRQELDTIKEQMNETVKGIKTLQTQLKAREQEVILERNLRKQLEKHLNQDELKKLLICDYAKPYAYF